MQVSPPYNISVKLSFFGFVYRDIFIVIIFTVICGFTSAMNEHPDQWYTQNVEDHFWITCIPALVERSFPSVILSVMVLQYRVTWIAKTDHVLQVACHSRIHCLMMIVHFKPSTRLQSIRKWLRTGWQQPLATDSFKETVSAANNVQCRMK
jgi:hypothetical protein